MRAHRGVRGPSELGVDAPRVRVEARGERGASRSRELWAENRRVEVIVRGVDR